jgi:chemotaxis response regulator CheB
MCEIHAPVAVLSAGIQRDGRCSRSRAAAKLMPHGADSGNRLQLRGYRDGKSVSAGRVLVVDDDALFRVLITSLLSDAGFEVCGEAADGETAVLLAQTLRPDVITMDIEMPILDGLSATRRIAALDLAPVIVVSGSPPLRGSDLAVAAGACCHVPKTALDWALPVAVQFIAELNRAPSVEQRRSR